MSIFWFFVLILAISIIMLETKGNAFPYLIVALVGVGAWAVS